MYANN